MNLYLLDTDIEVNVRCHVDDHVNKIALEAAQVLSTALWLNETPGVAYDASTWYKYSRWDTDARRSMHRAYGPTRIGPLSRWCQNPVNYMWTLRYAVELCKEHQYRKGKIIQTWRMLSQLPRFTVIESPKTWYAAVADELMNPDELSRGKLVDTDRAVEVYRQYYQRHRSHLHRWTKRERPEWLQS